jgi:hypothetical protein
LSGAKEKKLKKCVAMPFDFSVVPIAKLFGYKMCGEFTVQHQFLFTISTSEITKLI